MTSVLFVHREDLNREGFDKQKETIRYPDLNSHAWRIVKNYDMVIFVDDDGSHHVIKNRYA